MRSLPATQPRGLRLHFLRKCQPTAGPMAVCRHFCFLGKGVLCCAESFDGVHKGLQPGKDKLLRSSPKRTLPSAVLATSNNHVGTSQPSSSQTAHVEHHISMENISSQHTEPCEVFAIQDATLKATSSMSDPMDQGQDLPDYLANFLLHSSGHVRHTSLSALDNLEITSQADWACNHHEPKMLEEAQTKPSVQSVQGAASSWSVSCFQPDVQHGDFTTLSSPFYASSLSAERQVYGTQDEGVTYIDCTSIGDWTEAPPSLSAAAQAEQTRPHQWDPLQCTTSVLSSNRHGIARQDVRFGLSRGFSQQLVGPA